MGMGVCICNVPSALVKQLEKKKMKCGNTGLVCVCLYRVTHEKWEESKLL